MIYYVYQITNLLNSKIYIGVHQDQKINNSYMGSGKAIRLAIKKYGVENFKKEILFIGLNYSEILDKEKELVNFEFIKRRDTYNIALGGNGGLVGPANGMYGKSNSDEAKRKMSITLRKTLNRPEIKKKISEGVKKAHKENPDIKKKISASLNGNSFGKGNKGKPKSEETKRKMSEAHQGKKGTPHTDKWKKEHSENMTGKKHFNYGKTLSEETKKKISESLKKRTVI